MNEELRKALGLISKSKDDSEVQKELRKLVPDVTPKDAFSLLEKSDDGKVLLNSFADKRVTDGVTTALKKYKEKELPEVIGKAVKEKEDELTKKFNPELSEEAKRLLANEKEIAQLKKENAMSKAKAEVTSLFAKQAISTDFIDYFVSDDLDSSIAKASEFAEKFKQAVSASSDETVKKKFKELKFDPEKDGGKDKGTAVTKQDLERAEQRARELGTNESRAEYSILKKKYEFEQSQEQ